MYNSVYQLLAIFLKFVGEYSMKNKNNELNQTDVISITNSNDTNKEIVHLNTD